MSLLTLVRHGQALPFQKESDQLSDLGVVQSAALAAFWLKNKVQFDEVYTGGLVRQRRTEQIIAEGFKQAGSAWPAANVSVGFDEYDASGILHVMVPHLAERDERFAALSQAFEAARNTPDRNRPFQRMLEAAMQVWMQDNVRIAGVEPWPTFRDRTEAALREVMSGAGTRRVLVFTSGGPIGRAVQMAMRARDEMFLEVNWRIRNTSVTEFVFTGDRVTLDSFNGIPHLDDKSLWTYR